MSNSERSQKLSKFEFFAYFRSSPLRITPPQRNYAEIFSVRNESNFHKSLVHKTLFNTVVYGRKKTPIIISAVVDTTFVDIYVDTKNILTCRYNIQNIDKRTMEKQNVNDHVRSCNELCNYF